MSHQNWSDKTMRVPKPQSFLAPDEDAFSLGNLLQAAHEHLTESIMHEALALQKQRPGMKIGEALVSLGHITEAQVQTAIDRQKVLRRNASSGTRTDIVIQTTQSATQEVGKLESLLDQANGLLDKIASKLRR